ncbi:MAG: DUF3078 domain-containing protein [Calditrichaeota bacterium]|nr:MAG: DUF3078 domain-containing protein [Calditrichota bacterium]
MKAQHTVVLLLVGLFLAPSRLVGQESKSDSVKYGWRNEIIGTLNLTQASFDNWQQGGESALAWQIKLDGGFDLVQEKYDWSNRARFTLGFAKVAGSEARKSADEVSLESVYTRKLSRLLNPFFGVTAKTQTVAGFEYDDQDNKTKISKFLDPGYFTQSVGFGYAPNEVFKTRLGATVKETVTDLFPEESKVEPGISSVSEFKKKFEENVFFTSRLDIFSDLEAFDRIDVLWENNLNLKVTKFINVSLNVDLFYDKDVSSRRQIKQVLAVGFTYTFL